MQQQPGNINISMDMHSLLLGIAIHRAGCVEN